MKKVLIIAATAGLITLAACTPPAANNTTEVLANDTANAAIYDDTMGGNFASDNLSTDLNTSGDMGNMDMSTDANSTGNTM